jgi:uncharacterized alpha-E superfamily protein
VRGNLEARKVELREEPCGVEGRDASIARVSPIATAATAQSLTGHFDRAKTSASKIRSRLLETHSVATWEELVEYLLNLRDIMQNIKKCAKDVEGIQTSTLVSIAHVGSTVEDSNEKFSAHYRGRTPTPIF